MLKQGLYEQVVNTEIKDELRQLPEDSKHIEKIDAAESSSVLTQYLSEVVHKGLDRIAGDDISAQLNLVNKIVDLISQETAQDDLRDFTVDDEGEQLFALLSRDDPMMRIGRKKAKDLPRPETSIAQSSLFTGAIHKPQMFSELKKEIASADRIDMLVSFVKWSGLRLIIDDLQRFAERGGRLRVIYGRNGCESGGGASQAPQRRNPCILRYRASPTSCKSVYVLSRNRLYYGGCRFFQSL